jgi:hypothetical protein
MIRNPLRGVPALLLLAVLAASPVLAAEPRSHSGQSTGSSWSVLFERVLNLFGAGSAIEADSILVPGGALNQSDCGPTMDLIGCQPLRNFYGHRRLFPKRPVQRLAFASLPGILERKSARANEVCEKSPALPVFY